MIYGKKGILKLSDPNTFGGDVIYLPAQKDFKDHPAPQILNYGFSYSENSRGLGPSEMADAIFGKTYQSCKCRTCRACAGCD